LAECLGGWRDRAAPTRCKHTNQPTNGFGIEEGRRRHGSTALHRTPPYPCKIKVVSVALVCMSILLERVASRAGATVPGTPRQAGHGCSGSSCTVTARAMGTLIARTGHRRASPPRRILGQHTDTEGADRCAQSWSYRLGWLDVERAVRGNISEAQIKIGPGAGLGAGERSTAAAESRAAVGRYLWRCWCCCCFCRRSDCCWRCCFLSMLSLPAEWHMHIIPAVRQGSSYLSKRRHQAKERENDAIRQR